VDIIQLIKPIIY